MNIRPPRRAFSLPKMRDQFASNIRKPETIDFIALATICIIDKFRNMQ
jgi:hypothetical protein